MVAGRLHARSGYGVHRCRYRTDGTHPATIRGLAKKAGLLPDVPRQVVVPVDMRAWHRDAIAAKAAELGIDMEVLIVRVLESAVVLDDLYEAVSDGRYD